jgi:hypothetical protein
MRISTSILLLIALVVFQVSNVFGQKNYQNFKVAIYTRAYEVQKMEDQQWLESTWKTISSQLKVDKIYLETHRDLLIVEKKTLEKAINFFKGKGIEVAGGITYTIDESNQFQTFCYKNPKERAKAQEIIEYTASFFDEIILDDFFFTSCKCDFCVEAKGDRSWTDYRLELMTDAAKTVILAPAKKVNQNAKVIIKYPNWYEHFQTLGFNLETEPKLFDGLYTGTETRDAVRSNQHLQPYLGYLVYRYYNNLKPGKNGGGWVDTGGMGTYDRYAEQLWITLFAKAPEQTLFDYRQMLIPLNQRWEAPWKDQSVSFNYTSFFPVKEGETIAKVAGLALTSVDKVICQLGNPYGIKSYKPYHSNGEDFLQNYLGMIGIPMDLVPDFPMDDEMILLTESAKYDPEIVAKIKQRLINGKDVVITSGLLNALQDKGIRNIIDLEYTSRKSMVEEFMLYGSQVKPKSPILIPQIQYFTNDSWEVISGMDAGLGWPFLHEGKFSNARLFVLTIPENFADLYNLPSEVLNKLRDVICKPHKVKLEGTSMVSLFLYDNNSFILESFNNEAVEMKIILTEKGKTLVDVSTNEIVQAEVRPAGRSWGKTVSIEKYVFTLKIEPHSYRVFKVQ